MADPVAKVRKALAGLTIPPVAVIVPERHLTRIVVDPAAETEIKRSLLACGIEVLDVSGDDLSDWAKRMVEGRRPAWPVRGSRPDRR